MHCRGGRYRLLPRFVLPRRPFRRPVLCGHARFRLEQFASLGVERSRVQLSLLQFPHISRRQLLPCLRFPRSLRAGIRDREATDFYPASGYRASHSGDLGNVGTSGYAWSSAPLSASSVNGSRLGFYSSNVYPESNGDRSNGFPVRCVPDNKSVFSIIGCAALIRFWLMRPRSESRRQRKFSLRRRGGAMFIFGPKTADGTQQHVAGLRGAEASARPARGAGMCCVVFRRPTPRIVPGTQ